MGHVQVHYEIWVKEHLEPTFSEWLGGLTVSATYDHGQPITILSGLIFDQSALQSVLNKLMNMGITLLEVRRSDVLPESS